MSSLFLHPAGSGASFPYPRPGLVQCCDVRLSKPVVNANGLVTQLRDVSGAGHHLVAPAGSAGAQLVSQNGTPLLRQAAGGGASALATDYQASYTAYTFWLLFEVYQGNGGLLFPWFGSPAPNYQPNPFIYTGQNLQGYFGGGYGGYGPLIGDGIHLAMFCFDSGDGFHRVYHTGFGIAGQQSPGGSAITGACIGNDGLQNLLSFGFYNYAMKDDGQNTAANPMFDIKRGLAKVHKLPNL